MIDISKIQNIIGEFHPSDFKHLQASLAQHFVCHGTTLWNPWILAETNVLNAEGLIGDVVKVQTVAENPGEAPNPPFPVDFSGAYMVVLGRV